MRINYQQIQIKNMELRKFIATTIREYLNEQIENNNLDIHNVLKYLTPSNEEKESCIREHFDDLINRFSNLIPYFFKKIILIIIVKMMSVLSFYIIMTMIVYLKNG